MPGLKQHVDLIPDNKLLPHPQHGWVGDTPVPYRKGEKWAWVAVLITGMVSLIPVLIITYPVLGSNLLYVGFVTALILWIISIILSAYEIFLHK